MPDVEEIIGNAMQEAGMAEMDDFGQLQPTEGDDAPVVEGDEKVEPTVETKTDEVMDDKAKEKPPEGDDLDRELASLGLHGKDEGGKETRIRYSKIRRIWENYKIKYGADLKAGHDKALAEVQGKLTTAQQRSDYMGKVEALIENDPRRYFEMLAAANPKVRAVLEQPVFQAAAKRGVEEAQGDDPRPKPNAKFPDGTLGYDDEGLEKLEAWNRRQTVAQVSKQMEEKYGKPLHQMTEERQVAAIRQQSVERVQKNVTLARQVYGKLFDDDFGVIGDIKGDSAVMKALSNGQGLTFLEACAVALVPKMQADRNTMREDLLKEVNERPAAARRSSPEAAASESKDSPKSDEEIILREMRKARMIP